MDTVKKPLMIYIHIPFCIKKCLYCDFLSFGEDTAEATCKDAYVNALCQEISCSEKLVADRLVTSVFIGGGTPSALPGDYIKRICDTLRTVANISDDCEFTIECNPGTVTREKLKIYKECGINRISFGLQSACDEDLKVLGRIHNFDDFLESYRLAREAGFANINIDLMSAIPGQTVDKWQDNLKKVMALEPEHISAYSLIIEEGTPFYDIYAEGKGDCQETAALPDEDDERKIYYLTKDELHKAGYERYEISNYAKQGFSCRHNCGYWQGIEYLGFGLGAASLFGGLRFSNISDIEKYTLSLNTELCDVKNECDNIESYVDVSEWIDDESVQKLSENDRIEEFMFLGLRMCEGISCEDFKERFDKDIYSVYGEVLNELSQKKLMINENGRWRLTDYGIDLSNRALSEFLL